MQPDANPTSPLPMATGSPPAATIGYGHEPVIPPRIVRNVPRLDPSWFDKYAELDSTDICDKIGPLYSMSPDIVPLYRPAKRVVGQALTVKAWPGDSLAVHGALLMVQSGDVMVIDWRGHTASCGGGNNILVKPRSQGLRGLIIDGAWRDLDSSQDDDFPIFGKARNPFSPPKRRPGEVNVAVACGGVVVHAGDLVVADSEGIVVVPRAYIATVFEAVTSSPPPPSTPEAIDTAANKRKSSYDGAFAAFGGVETEWTEQ